MSNATVNSAICLCSAGTEPSVLVVTSVPEVQIGEEILAATTDTQMARPFGHCYLTGEPCLYAPYGIWSGMLAPIFVATIPLLVKGMTLHCTKGGTIEIVDAVQDTVDIGGCDPVSEPGDGFFETLIDDILMTEVANAPDLDDCLLSSDPEGKLILDFALTIMPAGKSAKLLSVLRKSGGSKLVNQAIVRAGKAAVKKALNKGYEKFSDSPQDPDD